MVYYIQNYWILLITKYSEQNIIFPTMDLFYHPSVIWCGTKLALYVESTWVSLFQSLDKAHDLSQTKWKTFCIITVVVFANKWQWPGCTVFVAAWNRTNDHNSNSQIWRLRYSRIWCHVVGEHMYQHVKTPYPRVHIFSNNLAAT